MAILAACEHLRDRFLFSLLAETGMRVGQALGLRHSDFVSQQREVHIVPRGDNANRARAKARRRQWSRSRPRWFACTRSTCTSNTARSTPTMCS